MAAKRRTPIRDRDLKGLKYFKILGSLLDRLHDNATARDHAGNRRLFYDQYACLLLLFFFNPVVKSLRSIQQASTLDKVQRLFGCNRVSRGSLSEASRVFDPELLHAIIGDIAAQTLPLVHGKEAEALRGLTAVDGSLLPALPKMAWALWLDPQHRAAKMHVHFDVLKGVPVETTVTAGNDSETEQLRATLQAQRLYVIDRGYAEYQLFQDILDARSDFIGRIRDNAVWSVRPSGNLALGDQPARPRCRVGRPRLPFSLDRGAIFPLAQMHPRLPSSAGQQPRGRHDPSLPGHHCQSPHQSLGGAQTNRPHPRDDPVLLHRLGHRRRTNGSPRPA